MHDEAWFYNKLQRDFPDAHSSARTARASSRPGECNIGFIAGRGRQGRVARSAS